MPFFDYLNLIEWVVALASLIGWLRFATFMSEDITQNLVDQPEIPWKLGSAGVAVVMLIVYIVMPNFWAGLAINFVITGTVVGLFWVLRVKTLGPSGHLFKGAIRSATGMSHRFEERKNARQVQLTYLKHDNTPMLLPPPQDPLAAGLGTADSMMIQAIERRAEVVDLSPGHEGYALSLITDGIPAVQPSVDRVSAEAAIQALKVLSGLSAEERRRPQTGKFRSRDPEGNTTTWTVRTSGSTAGEKVLLSVNEQGRWDLKVDQLGMSAEQLAEVKKLTTDTKGLVLVAAPKGQGRTATLYALMRQHDAFTNSVQTVETVPQTDIEGVTINRFEPKPGSDAIFSKLVQSVMLKDPNVLLVSQVPDTPTADLITKYAGDTVAEPHRVLTALPATDAFAALEMWLSMNANKANAANALRMIVAQRLVRILCPTCKIPYQPDEATMKRLNLPVGRNLQSFKANTEPIVDKKGRTMICPDCAGIGYRGRTGIFEVLAVTDEMKQAINGGANMNQVKLLARKNNMMLLVEHGIRKFAAGITTIHEVTRVMSEKPASQAANKSGASEAQK